MLIGVAIAGFFFFTSPIYKEISSSREQIASYSEALDNSKALEAERDKLTQKYNSFDTENLSRLEKLLPDNVNNIRLILEIEKIALPYGMVLKNVKYDSVSDDNTMQATTNTQTLTGSNKNYGAWDLEFSTQGTYNNFLNFLKDLENNLRIIDISSIQFSSSVSPGLNPNLPMTEIMGQADEIKNNFDLKMQLG